MIRDSIKYSSRFPFCGSKIVAKKGQEFESPLIDPSVPDLKECDAPRTSDCAVNTSTSFIIKTEEEPYVVDSEARESIRSPPEDEDITQIISFIIKDDRTTNSVDQQNSETKTRQKMSSDDRALKRKRHHRKSVKIDKKARLFKKVKPTVHHKSEKLITSKRTWLSGSNQEREEPMSTPMSTPCDSGFSQETVKKFIPELNTGSESGKWEKSVRYEDYFIENQGSCSRLLDVNRETMSSRDTEHESQVDQGTNQIESDRHFIAEKPYSCAKCCKCFGKISKLLRHQRIHSEERPYQCTECGKSYNRNDNLIRHQKLHTRDFIANLEMWSPDLSLYEQQK